MCNSTSSPPALDRKKLNQEKKRKKKKKKVTTPERREKISALHFATQFAQSVESKIFLAQPRIIFRTGIQT
jgi:hypothetical protein